jgi:hypothetical protein
MIKRNFARCKELTFEICPAVLITPIIASLVEILSLDKLETVIA